MLSSIGFQNWLYKLIIPYHPNQNHSSKDGVVKNIILYQRDGKKELNVL
jgi:hypothetical protein